MDRLQEVTERLGVVLDEHRRIERERDQAIRSAKEQITLEYEPKLQPLIEERGELQTEQSTLESEAAEKLAKEHPLSGRKVQCMRPPRNAGWYNVHNKVKWEGQIEVVTPASIQPSGSNMRYSRLPVGVVAVRVFNDKGQPLKKLERLSHLRDSKEAQELADKYGGSKPEEYLQRFWELVD